MNGHAVPIDDLLIHADFVRSLALDLVRDPAAADDLAQEAWVRALEAPPHHGAALRGWFATLLHRALLNRRRGERRRTARERIAAAAAPAGAPSPEEILDRELVRERLVRAVLRLDEPFRAAVLLRYYEDLPAPEIARRLGVPAATVRTRIARGMQRLREMLDDEHGGHRSAWAAPLATAWIRPRPALAATTGVIAMKKILLAAAALAVLSFAAMFVFESAHRPEPPATTAEAPSPSPVAAPEPAAADAPATLASRAAVATAYDARELRSMPADRGTGSIFGELVGAPSLDDIVIEASPTTGTLPPRMQLRDDRERVLRVHTDAGGAFRFDGVPAGPTRIAAVLANGSFAEATVIVARDTAAGPVFLRGDRASPGIGSVVTVRVVDGNGNALAGAETELFAWSASADLGTRIDDPRREPLAQARTGDDGSARWEGLAVRSGFVFARRGALVGRVPFDIGTGGARSSIDLELRLAPGVAMRGVLDGGDATALRDAVVSLHAIQREGIQWGGSRAFDAIVTAREFAFSDLPPGLYGVTLRAAGGARLVVPAIGEGNAAMPNSARMVTVELQRGMADRRFEVTHGARLRGRVTTAGTPVAKARVRAVLAPLTSNDTAGFVMRGVHVWRFDQAWENCLPDPITHVDTVTDADGRYELTSLQPGRHRVEVVANGLGYDRRMGVALTDGATAELEHELVPAGVLQVAALDLSYVGVRPTESPDFAMIAIVDGEHVTFPGLRPGRWQIARLHSDEQVAPVVLGEAEIVAGRTTWVDLRAASVAAILRGVVTSGGVPVAGASVSYWPAETRTDAFGAFRLALGYRAQIGTDNFGHPLCIGKGGVLHSWASGSRERHAAIECAVELGVRKLRVYAVDERGAPVTAELRLDATLERDGPGVTRVGIDAELAAAGAVFGPLPACELRGTVSFADGLTMPVAIPADATEWRLARIVTVPLVATVRDAQARALPGRYVVAWRWTGADPAPADPKLFLGTIESHGGKTGDDGVARLAVPPGEYAVFARALLAESEPVRVRIEAGKTPTVELTMQ